MVAGLDSVLALGHGGFALVVGDAEDGEAAVVFWAKDEADDVDVGEVEVRPISK